MIYQNEILENIFIHLDGKVEDVSEQHKKIEMLNKDDEDKLAIENLKKSLTSDEMIIKVKFNGWIEKCKKADWVEMLKIGNHEKFDLLFMRILHNKA
jgi:hypothetical protein